MSLVIAGTYMTVLEQSPGKFQTGPVLVIANDNSVSVDGVTIRNPTILETLSWNASDGNPSSALIDFATTATGTTCAGTYVLGDGPLPATNNIFGFNQPPPEALSNWNGTYNTFVADSSGTFKKDGNTVVIAAPNATYKGAQILNPLYTGISGTAGNPDRDQLAWFTGAGNADNVVVSFATDNKGNKLFFGTKWDSGAQPSTNNFTGTTADIPTPPTLFIQITATAVQISVVKVDVTEVEVVEVEVVEVEVVEVEVIEVDVVVLAPAGEEQKEGQKKPSESPAADKAESDAEASADLASKASRLASRKKPGY